MASYLTRQSERDVVQRYTVRFDWTDNSRTTAMEVLGNHVIRLVELYSSDVCLPMKPIFEKYMHCWPSQGYGRHTFVHAMYS